MEACASRSEPEARGTSARGVERQPLLSWGKTDLEGQFASDLPPSRKSLRGDLAEIADRTQIALDVLEISVVKQVVEL